MLGVVEVVDVVDPLDRDFDMESSEDEAPRPRPARQASGEHQDDSLDDEEMEEIPLAVQDNDAIADHPRDDEEHEDDDDRKEARVETQVDLNNLHSEDS
jgi:hypothetical protein